jgi:transposase-like protein
MKITLDDLCGIASRGAGDAGDRELPGGVRARSSQYSNNLIEQDDQRVKRRIRPMLARVQTIRQLR